MMRPVAKAHFDDDFDERPPFQVVIDKNLRSRQKRMQDETQEELTKVLERVENVILNLILRF